MSDHTQEPLNLDPRTAKQIEEFVNELTVLLQLSRDFEDTWNLANAVCDRYGLGRIAA